ncbi:MAG: Fe-S cluster assembly protein SufD, partial [Thermoleophilia bacterium]
GWEFTDLSKLDLSGFEPVDGGDLAVVPESLFELDGAMRLDQVDGAVGEGTAVEDGPVVLPLSVARERHPELVEPHLGRVVAADDVFTRWNEDSWDGGAFVWVPRGVRVDAPILLTAIADAAGTALHRRTLIVLDEGAEAEVWEQNLSGTTDAETMLTSVVELRVGQNAKLRYVCGQGLSEKSWIFGTQRAVVERDGSLDWVALGFGSARGKVRMETNLAGQGAEGRVTGAYAGRGEQHLDYDTTQEHAAPNTVSDLAFRGVLSGSATAVWRGMIRVEEDAQRTNAYQENRNLLLSKSAHADSIPGLEIMANDVRCTHGATLGQVDREQLFYLMARGLPRSEAERLIVRGFFSEILDRIQLEPVREALGDALEARIPEA